MAISRPEDIVPTLQKYVQTHRLEPVGPNGEGLEQYLRLLKKILYAPDLDRALKYMTRMGAFTPDCFHDVACELYCDLFNRGEVCRILSENSRYPPQKLNPLIGSLTYKNQRYMFDTAKTQTISFGLNYLVINKYGELHFYLCEFDDLHLSENVKFATYYFWSFDCELNLKFFH